MKNGECPVISWDVDSGSYDSQEANNFLEFFWEYLNEKKKTGKKMKKIGKLDNLPKSKSIWWVVFLSLKK